MKIAMMKHDTSRQPVAVDTDEDHTLKRGLWRPHSTSETPTAGPKSPITKAFDFLNWPRSRRTVDKTDKMDKTDRSLKQSSKGNCDTNTNGTTNAIASKGQEGKSDALVALNYQRNIFRNSGGLIRDILGDKLNKEKVFGIGGKRSSVRRAKQVVTRNKSLDINELINCVENELATVEGGGAKVGRHQRFLDDTFVENIMRAKRAYHHSVVAAEGGEERVTDGNYNDHNALDVDEVEDEYYYQQQKEFELLYSRSKPLLCGGGNGRQRTGNGGTGSDGTSPKHILFNDENTVYLIKKEMPVSRAVSSGGAKVTRTGDRERRGGESVLKARLKFKKLAPETTTSPDRKSTILRNNGRTLINDGVTAAVATTTTTTSTSASGAAAKRSILQRQNTSPEDYGGGEQTRGRSPSANRYQAQQQQQMQPYRYSPRYQRRNSVTDTGGNYDYRQQQQQQQQQQHSHHFDNSASSSSSMGSSGGSGPGVTSAGAGASGSGAAGVSITTEPSRNEKPRKKLSFREPVVAEKRRLRRHSVETETASGNVNACIDGNRINSDKLNNNSPSSEDSAQQSQAMRIVRTVGQAFEVCHKFNYHKSSLEQNDERSDISSDLLDVDTRSDQHLSDDDPHVKKEQLAATPDLSTPQRPNHLELVSQTNLCKSGGLMTDGEKSPTTPSSPSREILKLKDQLEQQALQTRQALAQLMLVREQLISETNARLEAQARTQQLLQQNRELLEHLASLGAYTEHQTAGLTSANIGMAPQSQLQMLLQATAGSANTNLATISQQINNLGSINQQLTSLSHQLSGLSQQSQNLQNFQSMQQQQQQQQQVSGASQTNVLSPPPVRTLTPLPPPPPTATTSLQQSPLQLSATASSVTQCTNSLSTSPYPSMNPLQGIGNQLHQLGTASAHQQAQEALSKDLFQVNQELLSRLQALNLGAASTSAALSMANVNQQATSAPHSSFFFVNPMSCSPSNNNNNNNTPGGNFNFLSTPTPSSLGNLTPSPIGTLSRNSYTNSPITDEMRLSIDKNLNALDEQLMKPMAQLTAAPSNGNIASHGSGSHENSRSSSTVESPQSPLRHSSTNHLNNNHNNNNNNNGNGENRKCPSPRFNTVMLKVTDEAGNVTNQRKLSATPSFITRSVSEKVPNRSQMMSQVQRTAWARHTTK